MVWPRTTLMALVRRTFPSDPHECVQNYSNRVFEQTVMFMGRMTLALPDAFFLHGHANSRGGE